MQEPLPPAKSDSGSLSPHGARETLVLSHTGAVIITLPKQQGRRHVPRAALLPGVSPVPATHGGSSGPCAPRFHPHIPT